ncbi:MAG: hypothetical protein HGA39_00465 [Coriobacteriia bacterium]|nr:hypothetical protein [Coriobacteriia bacterium]
MVHLIGDADDFWRLRVVHVGASVAQEFEWRDDVLYRRPPVYLGEDTESWHVEAVLVDDADQAVRLGAFSTADEATAYLESALNDLQTMSKSQFESVYFARAEFGDTGFE